LVRPRHCSAYRGVASLCNVGSQQAIQPGHCGCQSFERALVCGKCGRTIGVADARISHHFRPCRHLNVVASKGVSATTPTSTTTTTTTAATNTTTTHTSATPERLVKLDVNPQTRVATIWFDNPGKSNAMTADMGDQFREVVEQLRRGTATSGLAPGGVGAVVLTGRGSAFSAGGDMNFLRARSKDTPSRNAQIMFDFYRRFLCLRSLPVPVVAAVNGPAIGAGLCVALACDVRVALSSAKLGITFVGLGLHPGMGATHFLPQIVGQQNAARLILTGDIVTGDEAKAMGMVLETHATPAATLAAAYKIAARMAERAPLAVRSAVRTLRNQQDEGLERALWREADAQSQCYGSADLKTGVEAVVSKTAPQFKDYEHYLLKVPKGKKGQ